MQTIKKALPYLFTLCFFAVGFYAVSRIHDIIDWWKLRDYTPSEQIVSLADNSGMNDYGRRLFYVHDPGILDKRAFRDSCTVGEKTIVLGCYLTNDRIYIYDVTDERLAGIEEVTAAHEMLHAAFDRLSPGEKSSLEILLNDAYDRLTDQRIIDNVASYRSKDPSVVTNELHSILGTEVRQLPAELEEHYSKYFENRLEVVEKAERYAGEFLAREKKIEAYDVQLSQINGEITRLQAELKEQSNSLRTEKSRIESLRGDTSAFNSAVSTYNKNVAAYNNKVAEVRKLVDSYNQIVATRNEIAFEERELVDAIDTREESL